MAAWEHLWNWRGTRANWNELGAAACDCPELGILLEETGHGETAGLARHGSFPLEPTGQLP